MFVKLKLFKESGSEFIVNTDHVLRASTSGSAVKLAMTDNPIGIEVVGSLDDVAKILSEGNPKPKSGPINEPPYKPSVVAGTD